MGKLESAWLWLLGIESCLTDHCVGSRAFDCVVTVSVAKRVLSINNMSMYRFCDVLGVDVNNGCQAHGGGRLARRFFRVPALVWPIPDRP